MIRAMLILAMCFLLVGWTVTNEIHPIGIEPGKKFCPVCQKDGLKSRVYIGGCTITALWCGNGHYDEDGDYQPPEPCNKSACDYSCSNGHSWSE